MDASTILWTPGSPAGASILGASLDHVTNAYKHLWLNMRLNRITCILVLSLFLEGCNVSTQLPLEAEDVRICGNANSVIGIVKKISESQDLDFHYGTHLTDYGTQITFRLIGHNYEVELFNYTSEYNYTLRIYPNDSAASNKEIKQVFNRFKKALLDATNENCN